MDRFCRGCISSLISFLQFPEVIPSANSFGSKVGLLAIARISPVWTFITTADPFTIFSGVLVIAFSSSACTFTSRVRIRLFPLSEGSLRIVLSSLPETSTSTSLCPFLPRKVDSKIFSKPFFPTKSPWL